MGKKRNSEDETEVLKSQIKTLRSQIKHLKKELGRAQKRQHDFEEYEEDIKEEQVRDDFKESLKETGLFCKTCSRPLRVVDLKVREIRTCDKCNTREVIKK